MTTFYRVKPRSVDAVQYHGQEMPGLDLHHIGVDGRGLPIHRITVEIPGGHEIISLHHGDWLVDGRAMTAEEFTQKYERVDLGHHKPFHSNIYVRAN